MTGMGSQPFLYEPTPVLSGSGCESKTISVLLSAGFTPSPRFHYFSLRRSLQNVKTFPLPDFHNSNNSASAICKTALRAYRG